MSPPLPPTPPGRSEVTPVPPAPDSLPTNDTIEWTGQRYGLKPYLDPPPGLESADPGQVDALARALVEALGDADRFAVAHVLLTRLSGVAHETFPDWNGLAVALATDGSSRVDPAQREALARRWRAWLETEPHPTELPVALPTELPVTLPTEPPTERREDHGGRAP